LTSSIMSSSPDLYPERCSWQALPESALAAPGYTAYMT
jgi:hypothetical protein